MNLLPRHPDIDHLKKQAKDLLRLCQADDPAALERIRISLPAAAGQHEAAIRALELKLHDAQSCLAREYGFPSWANLKNYVALRNHRIFESPATGVPVWLNLVYGHDGDGPQPTLAARVLVEHPGFAQAGLLPACATGDEAALREAIAADPACVHQVNRAWRCPCCNRTRAMPPLAAVTHSGLLGLPQFQDGLRRSARLLLDAGADPNQAVDPGDEPLSALYGAAGRNHDAELTRMLLAAGANPNDGESLYHAVESGDPTCATLLLEAGARVEGSNALHHQLDYDRIEGLRLLLAYTRDANDGASPLGPPLLWAIRRRRSLAHVQALLSAGADPHVRGKDGVSAYVLALRYGLPEAADTLRAAGASEPMTPTERFIVACAAPDWEDARRILAEHPGVFSELSPADMQLLPNLADARHGEAVRLMVELGWPIAVRGGDWDATSLNIAVAQGDAALARFLLEHGASWTEGHGHGSDVNGTLAWHSRNHAPEEGDWAGCARALIDHGLPVFEIDGDYSDEVAAVIDDERSRLGGER